MNKCKMVIKFICSATNPTQCKYYKKSATIPLYKIVTNNCDYVLSNNVCSCFPAILESKNGGK